ncbi:acyltransferase family protein [Reyranella sp.]|uniref:acyltransferase family protein n=1 Tax=Reyranella sp. TaxID=1929291 RepID=UPI003BAB6C76
MTLASSANEIPSLTGLRGLAALLVVVDHFAKWTRIGPTPQPLLEQLAGTSGIGMAIFFTLSGYVITLSYGDWDWRDRPVFLTARLLLYRVARLYPAFLVFAVVILLRTPALHDLGDNQVREYVLSRLLLVYTWFPVRLAGMVPVDDHFHVAWSLSVEAGLYVGFAIGAAVVAALPRWRLRLSVLAPLFLLSTWLLLHEAWKLHPVVASDWNEGVWGHWLFLGSPYGVSMQFALGVVACRLRRHVPAAMQSAASTAGGLALVLAYGLVASGHAVGALDQALLVSVATALVMMGCTSRTPTNWLLSRPAIVFVGTVSYSLYLFHFLTPHMGFSGTPDTWSLGLAASQAVNFVIASAMATALATGMYQLVERPGRRLVRAAADRLLGIERPLMARGHPAE